MQSESVQLEAELLDEKCCASADMLGLSVASTASGSPVSLNGYVMDTSVTPSSSVRSYDASEFDAIIRENSYAQKPVVSTDCSRLAEFPRIVSPLKLLEESDDEPTWCGPPSEPEDNDKSAILAMKAWNIDQEHGKRRREGGSAPVPIAAAISTSSGGIANHDTNVVPHRPATRLEDRPMLELPDRDHSIPESAKTQRHRESRTDLIQPRGTIDGHNNKYVCTFQIGLDDDQEFCLVKRILGKNGCNMRRIAEECNAKIRLRGIGSGFLEGSGGTEANMPLNLNVSCCDFDSYKGAVDRVAALLKDLYKHYRRYSRANGLQPPDVKVSVEEVRRDDLGFDVLQQKAQRSSSQRERDRLARRSQRGQDHEREGKQSMGEPRLLDCLSKIAAGRAFPEHLTLPGGAPMPTTPAGRRLVAKSGGAEYAAIVSAAAREADKLDRVARKNDQIRENQMRDERKREAAERAAIVASRASRQVHTSASMKSPVILQSELTNIGKGNSAANDENTPPIIGCNNGVARGRSVAWTKNFDPWAEAAAANRGSEVPTTDDAKDLWTDFPSLQAASATGRKYKTYLI